jgi:hypothetical protein
VSDPSLPQPSLSSLAPQQRTRYLALYNFWIQVQTNCEAQLLSRSLNQPINSYTFNAGEGSQTTQRMTLKELSDMIQQADGQIRFYAQKVWGRGMMNHMLRRR